MVLGQPTAQDAMLLVGRPYDRWQCVDQHFSFGGWAVGIAQFRGFHARMVRRGIADPPEIRVAGRLMPAQQAVASCFSS